MNAQVTTPVLPVQETGTNEKLLFCASFIALIATAFGFILRAQIIESEVWMREIGLSKIISQTEEDALMTGGSEDPAEM